MPSHPRMERGLEFLHASLHEDLCQGRAGPRTCWTALHERLGSAGTEESLLALTDTLHLLSRDVSYAMGQRTLRQCAEL